VEGLSRRVRAEVECVDSKITPDRLGRLALVDGLRTVDAPTIRSGRGSFGARRAARRITSGQTDGATYPV
jgi:hypothetical protein